MLPVALGRVVSRRRRLLVGALVLTASAAVGQAPLGPASAAGAIPTTTPGQAALPGTFLVGNQPDVLGTHWFSFRDGDARSLELPDEAAHTDEQGTDLSQPQEWVASPDPDVVWGVLPAEADKTPWTIVAHRLSGPSAPAPASTDGTVDSRAVVARISQSACPFLQLIGGSRDAGHLYISCGGDQVDQADLPYVDDAHSLRDVTPSAPDGYRLSQNGPSDTMSPDGLHLMVPVAPIDCYGDAQHSSPCHLAVVASRPDIEHPFAGAALVEDGAGRALPLNEGAFDQTGSRLAVAPAYDLATPVPPEGYRDLVVGLATDTVTSLPGPGGGHLVWSPDDTMLAWVDDDRPDLPGGPGDSSVVDAAPADGSGDVRTVTPLPDRSGTGYGYYTGGALASPVFLAWQPDRPTDVQLDVRQTLAAPATAGQPFTVSWSLHNAGPATATGVTLDVTPSVLTDPLPLQARLVTTTGAMCPQTPATVARPELTYRCSLVDLPPGSSAGVSATFSTPLPQTTTFQALARSGQHDARYGTAASTRLPVAISDGRPDPTVEGRLVYETSAPSGCRSLWSIDPDGSDPWHLLDERERFSSCGEGQDAGQAQDGQFQVVAGRLWWLRSTDGGQGDLVMSMSVEPGAEPQIVATRSAADLMRNLTVSPDGQWLHLGEGDPAEGISEHLVPVSDPTQDDAAPPGEWGAWFDHGTRVIGRDAAYDVGGDSSVSLAGTDGSQPGLLRPPTYPSDHHTGDEPPPVAENFVWDPSYGSALVVGGYAPRADSIGPRTFEAREQRGLWRVTFEPAGTAHQEDWTFLGPTDAGPGRGIVSPTGTSVVYPDLDVDPGEPPRLLLRSLSSTAPYVGTGRSVGLPIGAGQQFRVLGWSDAPPVPGGTPDTRASRGAAPDLRPGVVATTGSAVRDPTLGIVAASADLSTVVEEDSDYPGGVAGLFARRRDGGPSWDLGPFAVDTVSPDGRYVAYNTGYQGHPETTVLDVDSGDRTRLPGIPTGRLDSSTFVGPHDETLLSLTSDGGLQTLAWREPGAQPSVEPFPDPAVTDTLAHQPWVRVVLSPGGRYAAWEGSDYSGRPGELYSSDITAEGTFGSQQHTIHDPDGALTQIADVGRAVLGDTVVDVTPAGPSSLPSRAEGAAPVPGEVYLPPRQGIGPEDPHDQSGRPLPPRLSPDGRHVWFAWSGTSGSTCGSAGLGELELPAVLADAVVTTPPTCASSLEPYAIDRAPLIQVVGVADNGVALAETAYHQDDRTGTAAIDAVLVALAPASRPPAVAAPVAPVRVRARLQGARAHLTWRLRVATSTRPRDAVLVRLDGHVVELGRRATEWHTRVAPGRHHLAVATHGPGGRSPWVTVSVKRGR